jgi:DNA-binding PadR family transcriptional regulator
MPRNPPLKDRILTALDEGEGTAVDLLDRIEGPGPHTFWQDLFTVSIGAIWVTLLKLKDEGVVTYRQERRAGERYPRAIWRKAE